MRSGLTTTGPLATTGRVPNSQVHRYYSLIDVVAYPRRSMRLTESVTPLKPLEAMAQGRLVVASDVGGHKELIKHQHNGYLFKANDADDLAATVLDLLNRPQEWEPLRAAGRSYVEQTRNWPNSVGFYKNIYAQLMARS